MKSKQILVFCLAFPVLDFFIYRYLFDYSIGQTIFQTIFMTVTMGLSFFFVGPKILTWMTKKLSQSIPQLDLLPNEHILLDAPANHFRGVEGVGGKLTLTNQRLVFVSHKLNIQNHRVEVERAAIASAKFHSRFAKGIVVTSKENITHTFIVDDRDRWFHLLNEGVAA